MPFEFNKIFGQYSKVRAERPRNLAPKEAVALVVSQSSKEGPFFPVHIIIIDKKDQSQVHHRPASGREVEYEKLVDFMKRELALERELFFLF